MKVQGIDFKWARMHIDSLLISDVAKIGTKEECWDYVFIHFKYLKEGCELSYDRASNLIPKDTLDNLIHKYYMTKLITSAENPDGLTFQDEPDLEIESASYDKERNTIFLDCKTTVSRNTQDI